MAIVSCPECSKKLKVADTSVGKKVKCSCGTVFVAEEGEASAAPPPAPSAAEKVLVSCTECASKVKVAATSLGKKMKCPKCAGIFVAALPALATAEETMPMPPRTSKPAPADDEEEPLNFAAGESDDDSLEEEKPSPKAKPRKKPVEDEDEEESSAAPQPAGKPVYPSRLLVNLFVLFLVLAYGGFFAVTYPGFGSPPLLNLGLVKEKSVQPIQLPGPIPPVGVPQPKGKSKKDQGDKEAFKKDDAKKGEGKKDDKKKDDEADKKPATDPDKDNAPGKDDEQVRGGGAGLPIAWAALDPLIGAPRRLGRF